MAPSAAARFVARAAAISGPDDKTMLYSSSGGGRTSATLVNERQDAVGGRMLPVFKEFRKHLPPDLQVATAIAYAYGWRTQSEVLTLERRHLDLDAGTLRLDPG